MTKNWGRAILGMSLVMLSLSLAFAQEKPPKLTDPEKAILDKLKTLRGLPDDQRGAVTKGLAQDIRSLPADPGKLRLAGSLANLSTEGDFGHDTLQEVATTLAVALRENPPQNAAAYSELASLIRYEHVNVSLDSPFLTQALAQLEAEDRDRQSADFTLNDLTGKSWTLSGLKGHVVLVNFWATWCPPCRKEMPDLDGLYRSLQNQGLVILAVSDEEAATVTKYLSAHPVSYPVLLDPGRKLNEAFHIGGIPKSFVYDREGKLVAQAIDMRTQHQFIDMLRHAGLELK